MASMAIVALAEAEVASVAAWGRREQRRSSTSSAAALMALGRASSATPRYDEP